MNRKNCTGFDPERIREIRETLEQLQAELRVRDNPERQARAKLKPNRFGWTRELYTDEAFKIWEGMLRRMPDDLQSVQHLAIMHHARAFDREESDDPSSADEDWRRALELWHRLWQEDRFWEDLSRRVDSNTPNPFLEVRAAWPRHILQIHFDIAFDDQTKHYRAREHIQFAIDSPFPQTIKDEVRLKAYERATSHLPLVVWQSTTFDHATLEPALRAITNHLDINENFLPALTDLLGLLVKIQTGHVQQTYVVGDAEGLQNCFQRMRDLGSYYDPYVKQIELSLQQLSLDVVSDLALWHSRIGQASRRLNDYEKAAAHFRRALTVVESDGSDEKRREEIRQEWLLSTVLAAQKHARGDANSQVKALELLESIDSQERLPSICLFLRADTEFLLEDFHAAESSCEAALHILHQEQQEPNFDAANAPADLERNCRKLLESICRARRQSAVRPLLDKASEAMRAGRWGDALNLLNQAVRIDSDDFGVRFLRCQCLLHELKIDQAKVDLDRAEELAKAESNHQVRESLNRLRRDLNQARRQSAVRPLLDKASEAMRAGRWGDALNLLNQAVRIDSDDFGVRFLRCQCLLHELKIDQAKVDLDRAEELAKAESNHQVRESLNRLRRDLNQLQRQIDLWGGAQSFRLAAEAFEAKNPDHAASLLRQALEVAHRGGKEKIKKELATCLDVLAVQKANSVIKIFELNQTSQLKNHVSGIELKAVLGDLLKEAVEMLNEANQLNPGDGKIRDNLAKVQDILQSVTPFIRSSGM